MAELGTTPLATGKAGAANEGEDAPMEGTDGAEAAAATAAPLAPEEAETDPLAASSFACKASICACVALSLEMTRASCDFKLANSAFFWSSWRRSWAELDLSDALADAWLAGAAPKALEALAAGRPNAERPSSLSMFLAFDGTPKRALALRLFSVSSENACGLRANKALAMAFTREGLAMRAATCLSESPDCALT